MRVALCLSGHMRCFRDSYVHIKKNIIDRYHPDVFISTWSTLGFWSCEDGGKGFHPGSPDLNEGEIVDLYKPNTILVQTFEDVEHIFEEANVKHTNWKSRPKNMNSLFYKAKQSLNAMFDYARANDIKYDLVIRMRPDMGIGPLPRMEDNLGVLWIKHHVNYLGEGTGTDFHAGSMANMRVMAQLYDHIDALYARIGFACGHLYVSDYLRWKNVPFQSFNTWGRFYHSPKGEYKEPEK